MEEGQAKGQAKGQANGWILIQNDDEGNAQAICSFSDRDSALDQ